MLSPAFLLRPWGYTSSLPENRRSLEKWHWVPVGISILVSWGYVKGPPAGHWRAGPWLSAVGQLSEDPGGAYETWQRLAEPWHPLSTGSGAFSCAPWNECADTGRTSFPGSRGNFLELPGTPPLTCFHLFLPLSVTVSSNSGHRGSWLSNARHLSQAHTQCLADIHQA